MFTSACDHLWYSKRNSGAALSQIQKSVMPPTRISERCVLGMVSKYRASASMPEATALALRIAQKTGGIARSTFYEQVFNVPTTAHILGGCCMGDSEASGVIDHQHRMYGYDGLYVVDGSAISANIGVNW